MAGSSSSQEALDDNILDTGGSAALNTVSNKQIDMRRDDGTATDVDSRIDDAMANGV